MTTKLTHDQERARIAQPLFPYRDRARLTFGYRIMSCCMVCSMFIWVIGLFVLYYMVHVHLVFLDPPLVNQSGISYYNKLSPANAAKANIGSFAYWAYTSDYWLILPVLYVPAAWLIASIIPLSIWLTGVPIVMFLYFLLELAKSIYFSIEWIGANCQKFPFCVHRAGAALLPADSTYVMETMTTYVFTLLSIGVIILLIFGFNTGRYQREVLVSARNCVSCGDKIKSDTSFRLDAHRSAQSDVVIGEPVSDSSDTTQRRTKRGAATSAALRSDLSIAAAAAPGAMDVAAPFTPNRAVESKPLQRLPLHREVRHV